VLGEFANPGASSVPWKDIGSGMSHALARTLLNRAKVDVVIDAPLAERVRKLLQQPKEKRGRGLDEIRGEYPRVRFIVLGRVTDFAHNRDLASDLRQRDFLFEKKEAVVAIQLDVVDLDQGRVVASDHVHGVAKATRAKPDKLYENVVFGSYVFWTTPLGKASEVAIDEAMAVLDRVVPSADGALRITEEITSRRVRIAGEMRGVQAGRVYRIAAHEDGAARTIFDPQTGLPLEARIDDVGRQSATAWLLGQPPASVDLNGAVLIAPPAAPSDLSSAAGAE
jgi:curli biogenesis system outer membrane secretion channel CsgG